MSYPKRPSPIKISNGSLAPGWITLSTILTRAMEFTIVVGIPEATTTPRTIRARLRSDFKRKCDELTHHSHYEDEVLYLVPRDYKAWVEEVEKQRKERNASQTSA